MFELWAQGLSLTSCVVQISKAAQQVIDSPVNFPYKAKYRALARELNKRGAQYPIYPTQVELRTIAKGEL